MKKIMLLSFILLLSSCGVNNSITNSPDNQTQDSIENTSEIPLENWDVIAVMKTTKWDITLLLNTSLEPITTSNFIGLAKKDFYDGITFHRVIDWFMIQWGDPLWTWAGWESIYWDTFKDEFSEDLSNVKYTIAMANAWPNTNSSQFFINVANNTVLDFDKQPLTSKHAVFGRVIAWYNIVDSISKVEVSDDGYNKPIEDVIINDIEIKEYQDETFVDYVFDEQEAVDFYENKLALEKESKKDKELETWDTVSVDYTLYLEDGTVVDSSYSRWVPFSFTLWEWQVIPGWENGLLWHKIWDNFKLEVSPEDWYWEKEMRVAKSLLQQFADNGYKLEKWTTIPVNGWEITILDTEDDFVIIENPNELAWKTLFFDIEVLEID